MHDGLMASREMGCLFDLIGMRFQGCLRSNVFEEMLGIWWIKRRADFTRPIYRPSSRVWAFISRVFASYLVYVIRSGFHSKVIIHVRL